MQQHKLFHNLLFLLVQILNEIALYKLLTIINIIVIKITHYFTNFHFSSQIPHQLYYR
jgi:hypothetical protein